MYDLTLNADNVSATIKDCLLTPEQADPIRDLLADPSKRDAVAVEHGVKIIPSLTATFGLQEDRVEIHRPQVARWLLELPEPFRASSGGGWSFLNACQTEGGSLWTGIHKSVESLLALGIAADLGSYQGLEIAAALPGGLPYYTVDDAACRAALDTVTTEGS